MMTGDIHEEEFILISDFEVVNNYNHYFSHQNIDSISIKYNSKRFNPRSVHRHKKTKGPLEQSGFIKS